MNLNFAIQVLCLMINGLYSELNTLSFPCYPRNMQVRPSVWSKPINGFVDLHSSSFRRHGGAAPWFFNFKTWIYSFLASRRRSDAFLCWHTRLEGYTLWISLFLPLLALISTSINILVLEWFLSTCRRHLFNFIALFRCLLFISPLMYANPVFRVVRYRG